MVTQHKEPLPDISLIEAVETLSNIADLELDREIGVTQKHDLIIQRNNVTYRTVHWLETVDPESTMLRVKGVFKVVLNYLKEFYKKEYHYVGNKKTMEGVQAIMVLVGEAAKKLDRYTTVFQGRNARSVTYLKEYKELQEFYLTRIARKIDEGTLGKWILGLTQDTMAKKRVVKLEGKKTTDTKNVFIDLDSVKKDTEYELFYMRKEDGSRFFSPRLIRNVKLVCDFGEYFGRESVDDPFINVQIWQDRIHNEAAQDILQSVGSLLDWFYEEAADQKNRELVKYLNQALMALMLSANARNILKNNPVKCSLEYFKDFQDFLREALETREYQKMVAYRRKRHSKLAKNLMELTHELCRNLFTNIQILNLVPTLDNLIDEAQEHQSSEHNKKVKTDNQIWSHLASDYRAMEKLIKRHPGGPLVKVLELLEQGTYKSFDPIHQHNIPCQLFSLYSQDRKITNIRIPTPTEQEFIQRAKIVEDFKAYLRSYVYSRKQKKHLMINFQDRTSWREHFRCRVLEELPESKNFENSFYVVTLPKDTEFYNQQAPYHLDNHADVFMNHFKEHLTDTHCGFYFPELIKKHLFPDFVDGVMENIHKVFFSNKNVLSRSQRLDFIEIFYMFLELKLIDITTPDTFSLTCKDGIDISGSANVSLYTFIKIFNNEPISDEDFNQINTILYIPSLLNRERNMLPDRFNRMISALRRVENCQEDYGAQNFETLIKECFDRFYESPILHSMLILPKKES